MTPIETLSQHADARPNDVALIAGADIWTYDRLADNAERLADGLTKRGLRRGDRVALHMANRPELIVAYYACLRIGAIAAPLNTRLKTPELIALMGRLQPSVYLGDADLYARAAAVSCSILALDQRFIVGASLGDPGAQPWARLFDDPVGAPVRKAPDALAPAVLLTTSGTTGQPKFVVHTQRSLSAIADSFAYLGIDGGQIAVGNLPMVHAAGFTMLLACVRFGTPVVLLERFEPDAVLHAIEHYRCTWLLGLPAMYVILLQRQRAHPRNVGSLQTCICGGDVCPPGLQDGFQRHFSTPLRSLWASTEAVGCLTYGLRPGPVSRVIKGAQVRLVDETGATVRQGEAGEMILRGPNVTAGYWVGPNRIEDAPKDGWFHSGDLMRQDENGDLWFVSRKKDIIIRGGSNISPVEIEQVLLTHPAVKDAAVVGIRDPVLGERVLGYVALTDDAHNTSLDDIRDYVSAQLADYKVPEKLETIGEIPRNELGKIDRKRLVAMSAEMKDAGQP